MESFDKKTPRSQLNGRMDDEASSEIDQRVAPAERDRTSRKLIGAITTPDISRSAMSLMSSRKTGSRMGSVNPEPSSQNFRFLNSTASRPETTPISSPSFAGFPYHKDAEEERSVDEDGFRGGNLGYEDMLARLEEVKDFYAEAFPNEKDLGGNIRILEQGPTNNHPYFSSPPTIPLESRAQSSDNGIGNLGNRESSPAPQTMFSPRIHTSSQAQDYLTGMDPALDRFRAGRESLSVTRNITVRESKRSKGRSQDLEYKRRSSISGSIPHPISSHELSESPVGNSNQPQSFHGHGSLSPEFVHSHHPLRLEPSLRINNGTTQLDQGLEKRERRVADCTLPHSTRGFVRDDGVEQIRGERFSLSDGQEPMNDGGGGGYTAGANRPPVRGAQAPGDWEYVINLTHEGRLVRHQVNQQMMVEQLVREAAGVYDLYAPDLILMLFGMNPQTLPRNNHLSDPPRVGPGATVLVFCIAGHARNMGGRLPPPPPTYDRYNGGAQLDLVPTTAQLGSKLLGNFKLPKFDGNARYWKTWDKNFVRFLSIHQLDFVIEESFLNLLPLTPRNFEANKMVYYILEDAVVTGSLAAKYLRQAAKWNGNEAYTKLLNGYVFSGPQTMSLLLAELVNIRFKSDESASGFCLRLREVFEDLEMVLHPLP